MIEWHSQIYQSKIALRIKNKIIAPSKEVGEQECKIQIRSPLLASKFEEV